MAHQRILRFHRALVAKGIAAVLALLLLFYVAYFLRPAIRARYLLRQLETLELGHATFEDAQQLAKKIGANPTSYGPCDRSVCEWEAKVDNSKIPRWWRGSGETFLVSYNVKDSMVVRKNVGYGIGIETDKFYPSSAGMVQQEHWGRSRIPEPVSAGWQTTDLYRYYEFGVYMTPKASAEDRRRYTSYNFNCFWKYKGCKDARELLPAAARTPLTN